MLDMKFVRANPELVKENIKKKLCDWHTVPISAYCLVKIRDCLRTAVIFSYWKKYAAPIRNRE